MSFCFNKCIICSYLIIIDLYNYQLFLDINVFTKYYFTNLEGYKLNLKTILSIITITIFMNGCSNLGPMQTPDGLLSTKQFKPIFLSTIEDGSTKILFKEYTTMYENKDLKSWGTFIITDKGTYFAMWNTMSFEYNVLFKLSIKEINNFGEDTIVRDMWIDSELLTIKDNNNNEVGFALNGKRAAYTTLNRLINKQAIE